MLLTFSSFVTEAGSISFKLRNLQGHTRTFLLLPQNFTQLYLTLFERGVVVEAAGIEPASRNRPQLDLHV